MKLIDGHASLLNQFKLVTGGRNEGCLSGFMSGRYFDALYARLMHMLGFRVSLVSPCRGKCAAAELESTSLPAGVALLGVEGALGTV